MLSVAVDAISDELWHAELAGFADAHYEQTALYAKGHRGERDSHLVLRRDGTIVAGARVALYRLPAVRKGIALVRFGPFWRRRGADPDPALYRTVVHALADEYCERRGLYLTIRPRPAPPYLERECEMLQEIGFVQRRKMPVPDRYLIDLALDEDAQLKSLDQKWRKNLRDANANALDIRYVDSREGVAAFDAMYSGMVERKALNYAGLHLVRMIPALMQLPPPIGMRVALAFHDGQPVAGATVGVLGDMAYYVFGASTPAGLALTAGYALQWWILRGLAGEAGVRWYDLGGTGDPGIRQFKRGFVGKRGVVVDMKQLDRWTQPSARLAADAIFALRDARDAIRALRRLR